MSLAHVPAQAVPEQVYGAHDSVVGTHAIDAHAYEVCVAAVHVVGAHVVPSASMHVPSPWHVSASHIAAFAVQAACGSLPSGTFEQVPTDPARLHALHPSQLAPGVSQQTLSTQLPEPHASSAAHIAPSVPCAAHVIVDAQ
jgi:hypothetical protein